MIPLLKAAGADDSTIAKMENYADVMERFGVTITPDNLGILSGIQGLLPGGGTTSTPGSSGSTTVTPATPSTPGSSGSTAVTPTTPSSGSTSSASGIESVDIATLRLSLQYLNSNQLDALQAVYGPVQEKTFSLDDLAQALQYHPGEERDPVPAAKRSCRHVSVFPADARGYRP